MSAMLVGIVAVPLLALVIALLAGSRHSRLVGRLGAGAAGVGFLGSSLLLLHVAVDGSVSADVGSRTGASIIGLEANRLTVLLLLLVYGVSTVAQAFALRYLAGDHRSGWFTAGASLLTAASAGLMTSSTLVGLALCWTLAGTAMCLLLATYWGLPSARDGVRRTATAFVVGDLALWSAVGMLTIQYGNMRLSTLGANTIGSGSPTLLAATCLIVVAALSRSAQIPFHRWLPATLAAPTPVSALLHAGVVNAGGVLLVRTSPIVSQSGFAMGLAFAAGTMSMAYGAVVMLTKPDIKGTLVFSTMAQMGFMILTCGLGLSAAAVFHLVGHGFYKATLFLSSGSAIAKQRRKAERPPAPQLSPVRWAAVHATAMALPAAALYLGGMVIRASNVEHGSAEALLVFAWATGAAALAGWLGRSPGARTALVGTAATLPIAVGYLALVNTVTGFLARDIPAVAVPAASTAGIAGVAVLLGLLTLSRRAPGVGRAGRVQRALYTRLLAEGHIPTTRPTPLPTNHPLTLQLTGAPQ